MGSTFADSDYGDTVESQLTLGTASLLGIFFGLVMVCGIFFGFGYSIGRRNASSLAAANTPPAHAAPLPAPALPPMMAQSSANSVAALTPETMPVNTANVVAATPAVPIKLPSTALVAAAPKLATPPPINMSGTSQPKPAMTVNHPLVVTGSAHAVVPNVTPLSALSDHAYLEPKARIAKPSAISPTMEQPTARIPLQRVVAGPQFSAQNLPSPYLVWTPPFDVHYKKGFKHGLTQSASHTPLTAMSHPAGTFTTAQTPALHLLPTSHPVMTVQVAALSRQDDAEVLVSALRQHGYAPSIQSGNQDALYHVQVGPFSRDVAFATRQRLIARGYNATLK